MGMLQFGMETVRINDIVNRGAATRLNDIQFIQRELEKWLVSQERIDAMTLATRMILDKKHFII